MDYPRCAVRSWAVGPAVPVSQSEYTSKTGRAPSDRTGQTSRRKRQLHSCHCMLCWPRRKFGSDRTIRKTSCSNFTNKKRVCSSPYCSPRRALFGFAVAVKLSCTLWMRRRVSEWRCPLVDRFCPMKCRYVTVHLTQRETKSGAKSVSL